MKTFQVTGPDGRTFDVTTPEGKTGDDAMAYIKAIHYSGAPAAAPVQPPVQPEPEDQSVFRSIADVPLSAAKGVTTGVGSIADAMGANNQISQAIYGAGNYLDSLLSAGAKQDQQEVARIMQEAQDKGAWEQVKAGLNALTVAPVDLISNVLGTAAPVVIATLYAGAAAIPVGVGLGVTTGVGIVKNTIYNAVLEEAKKVGVPEDQAIKAADAAQSYTGDNADLIAGGGVLGAIASVTGLEATALRALQARILKKVGKELAETAVKPVAKEVVKGAPRRFVEGFAKESSTEAAQAGQEQLAGNLAAQRAGFNVPTMRGVAGAAALEGIAGGLVGGGADVFLNSSPAPDEAKNALNKFIEEAGYDPGSDEAGTFENLKLDAESLGVPVTPEDNIETLGQKIQAKELENTVAKEKLVARAEANGIPVAKDDTEEDILAKLATASTKDTTPVSLIPEKLREAARVSGVNIGKNDTLEDVVNNLAASSVPKPVRADIPTPTVEQQTAAATPAVEQQTAAATSATATPTNTASAVDEEGEGLFTQGDNDAPNASESDFNAGQEEASRAAMFEGVPSDVVEKEDTPAATTTPTAPSEFIKYDPNDPFRDYADETAEEMVARELREAEESQGFSGADDYNTLIYSQGEPEEIEAHEKRRRLAGTKQLFGDLGIPLTTPMWRRVQSSLVGNLNDETDTKLHKELIEYKERSGVLPEVKANIEKWLTKYFRARIEYEDVTPDGRAWARYNYKTEVVTINPKELEKRYNDKAWTKPKKEGVTPLPEDTFKTLQEWRDFIVAHENTRAIIRQNKGESLGDYENRINAAALDQIGKPAPVDLAKAPDTAPELPNSKEPTLEGLTQEEQQLATPAAARQPVEPTPAATPVAQGKPGIQDLSKEDEDARASEQGAKKAKTKQLFDDLGINPRAAIRQKFMYSNIDLDLDLEKALTKLLTSNKIAEDTKAKIEAWLGQRTSKNTNGTMKSPIYDAPPLSEEGKDLVRAGNLGGVIGHLINNTKNPVVRRALIAIAGLNLKTKLVVGPLTDSESGAEYDIPNDTITVAPTQINEPALVHDIIHAGISHVLFNPNHPLTKELTRLFKLVKSKLGDRYGTKSVDEFASELIANEEFQEEIKALKNNIFMRIMRAIAELLLGFPPKASIFDQAVNTVTDIISISDQVLRKDNEFGGRRGQLNPNAPGVNKKIAKIADITATADEIVDESGVLYTTTQALLKNDYSKLSSMFGTMMNKAQRAAFMHALTTRGLFGVAEKLKISALAAVENLLLRKLPGLRNDMRKLDDRFIDLILKWGAKNGKNLVRLGIATNAARIFQINPRGVDLTTAIENDATVAYYDSRINDPNYRNNKSHNQKRKAARIKEINYVYQAYEALGVEGQNIFTRMNETYKKQLTDYESAIRENVSAILENVKTNTKQTEEQALKEKEDLEAALSPIFKALFSEVHKVGVYFPLGRHGNFWVRIGKGKNGETQFFDSEVARDIYIKSVRSKYAADPNKTPPITKGSHPDELQKELFSGDNKIGTTLLLKQLFDKIDALPGTLSVDLGTGEVDLNKAVTGDLKNSVLDMYLRSLPGADLRKRYMHSTMKAGFSSDVLRTFINYSFRHSNQLPRLKYAQQIALQLSAARDSIDEDMPDDEAGRIQDLVLAIRDRAMPELAPQGSDTWGDFAAQFANQATFLYTMTSLRTALVALTQLPVFGTPKLVANYGLADTTRMIAKYTGSILAGNTFSMKDVHTDLNGDITHDWVMPNMAGAAAFKNNPRLVDAYETALSWGTFVNGFGSEFQAAGERPTRKQFTLTTRTKKLAMTFMTGAFKTTERMSREIMFMSTYELAFDKATREKLSEGDAHTRAINEADKFTNQTMFDYSRANKQPILYKTPGARVLFQFMTFPINVAGFMVRNAATLLSAVKEKDPAMAKAAAVEFFGTMGCVFMFSGVTGLPFYSLIMGVMDALRDQLFDPEEYDDKTDPRSNVPLPIWFTETYLPRIFGGGASVVQSGPISALLDINIGSSVGLNNLFFKDEVLADGAKDWVQKYMLGVFSPPSLSVVGQIASGVDLINEGQFLRGAERIMPAQFRGSAVALRLGKEGSETPTGMRLLDPEFYTTGKLVAQGVGFKTVTEEQISKANFAAKGYVNTLEIDRNQFLKRLNNAYRAIEKADSKDTDSLWLKFNGIVDEMIEFSKVNPVVAFTSEGINTSLRSKVEAREKSKYTKGLSASSDKQLDLLMQLLNREYE